jgi:hypothetical protein
MAATTTTKTIVTKVPRGLSVKIAFASRATEPVRGRSAHLAKKPQSGGGLGAAMRAVGFLRRPLCSLWLYGRLAGISSRASFLPYQGRPNWMGLLLSMTRPLLWSPGRKEAPSGDSFMAPCATFGVTSPSLFIILQSKGSVHHRLHKEEPDRSIDLHQTAAANRAQARAQPFGIVAAVGADTHPVPGGVASS